MALDRGPGVIAEEQKLDATPETGEIWMPYPDGSFPRSITFEEVGAADGVHKALRIFVYDKARNVTMSFRPENGPDTGNDFFVNSSTPSPTPSATLKGFDIAFPQGQSLVDVINALDAAWCLVYIGGPNYAGNWTPQQARLIQPSLLERADGAGGFGLCYVGANYINGILHAGPLNSENGIGHGVDAWQQATNYGFTDGTIFLDVESDTYEADPSGTIQYATAWVQGLYGAGPPNFSAGMYGSRSFLNAMRARVDPLATYLANWDGVPDLEGMTIHQYRGSTTIDGVGVDLDIAQVDADFQFSRLT